LKKAQYKNKKTMDKKQFEPKELVDEKLIEKVGIDHKTKGELKTMQENLPIGGNLYFELNRIAYDNDMDKRRHKIETIHDYTLNKSPIKNLALDKQMKNKKQIQFENSLMGKNVNPNN
jgi:hypothetical protein